MRKLIHFMFFIMGFTTYSNTLLAQNTKYTFSNGTCVFHAVGNPGFLKINGEGGKVTGSGILEGNHKIVSVEAHLALKDFTTGMDTRDGHMREKYLEIEKYPGAILKIENIAFKEGKTATKGILTLHGKSREIQTQLNFESHKKHIAVKANFSIALTDFGIEIPHFMSVTVAKDVEVEVELDAIPAL